jgi:23S rRNA (pseudouridine1915-N3)-methyltransferase
MKIILLCVGKLRSAPFKEVCADFLTRLQRYGAAEVREVKASDAGSPAQSVSQECGRLLDQLEPNDSVFVLDERGIQISSVELSDVLNKQELRGVKRCVLILGGAYGLSDEIRSKGKLVALSRLTLPHELCRVVMLEQLYRARSIQKGEPYHHI